MEQAMNIEVMKLVPHAQLPVRQHPDDAGLDLFAAEEAVIPAGGRRAVGTGVAIGLPSGYVALFWDRSGLAFKYGITVLGGVIDASYRGEYRVMLYNTSVDDFQVARGDRIAQMLIQRVELCGVTEVTQLTDTERSSGGFGSTGR